MSAIRICLAGSETFSVHRTELICNIGVDAANHGIEQFVAMSATLSNFDFANVRSGKINGAQIFFLH